MTALIDQLDTHLGAQLTSFSTVALSWTSEPIEDFSSELPAALHYLAGTDAEPNDYDNQIVQTTEHRMAVLMVCPVGNLSALQAELRGALVGWQPAGDSWDMTEYVGGEMVMINQGIAWWREIFAVNNYANEV